MRNHSTLAPDLHLPNTPFGDTPLFVEGIVKPVAGLSRLQDRAIELHKFIRNEHLATTPAGIAFNADLFRRAVDMGATIIKVTNRDTGAVYRTTGAVFDLYAFTQDRKHGIQRFLKLQHWSINGAAPTYTPKTEPTAVQNEDLQLALFGGAS